MKPILALLLSLLCLTASASPGQPYFVRQLSTLPVNLCDARIGDGTPTNLVGYPAYTWWIAQCGLSTNGAGNVQYLSDVSTNGLNGTNDQVKGQWLVTQANALNGYDIFVGSNGVYHNTECKTYTNSGNAEFVFVSKTTNTGGAQIFFNLWKPENGGSWSDGRVGWITGGNLDLWAGAHVAAMSASPLYNKWAVYNFVFAGASSTIYTNNVAGASGDPSTQPGKGMILFSGYNVNPFAGSTAEIITYRTNLSTAARTTLFNYLTNKYNISP